MSKEEQIFQYLSRNAGCYSLTHLAQVLCIPYNTVKVCCRRLLLQKGLVTEPFRGMYAAKYTAKVTNDFSKVTKKFTGRMAKVTKVTKRKKGKVRTSVTLFEEVHYLLRVMSAKTGRDISEFVNEALINYYGIKTGADSKNSEFRPPG